jgi:hypothetical protein
VALAVTLILAAIIGRIFVPVPTVSA